MHDCWREKVRFSTTVSCFSALWTSKKVSQNACFERQHRVSGLFLKGAKSTKCVNLTRASRFRAVFAGRKIWKMCEFDKSFVFQACFWRVQNQQNVRVWQELLRVSELFLACQTVRMWRLRPWKVRFSTTVSCFSALWAFKKCYTTHVLNDSIVFQARFWMVKGQQHVRIWQELRVSELFLACQTVRMWRLRAVGFVYRWPVCDSYVDCVGSIVILNNWNELNWL